MDEAPENDRVTKAAFIGLVLAAFIIAASCSAVVGAVMYAGWIEPGSGLDADCQTAP